MSKHEAQSFHVTQTLDFCFLFTSQTEDLLGILVHLISNYYYFNNQRRTKCSLFYYTLG